MIQMVTHARSISISTYLNRLHNGNKIFHEVAFELLEYNILVHQQFHEIASKWIFLQPIDFFIDVNQMTNETQKSTSWRTLNSSKEIKFQAISTF